jgi:hypothetical protein
MGCGNQSVRHKQLITILNFNIIFKIKFARRSLHELAVYPFHKKTLLYATATLRDFTCPENLSFFSKAYHGIPIGQL